SRRLAIPETLPAAGAPPQGPDGNTLLVSPPPSAFGLPLAEAVHPGDDTTLPPTVALWLWPLRQRPRQGCGVPRPSARLLQTAQRAERDSMGEPFSRPCSAARRGPGASAQYPLLSALAPLTTSPG